MKAEGHEAAWEALHTAAIQGAHGRHEPLTTLHLLAIMARSASQAGDLLRARRLHEETLLHTGRGIPEESSGAVVRALLQAKEFAGRCPPHSSPELPLLVVLCQERETSACRTIVACGIDRMRLRTAAMQLALGMVEPRRDPWMQPHTKGQHEALSMASQHQGARPSALPPRALLPRTLLPRRTAPPPQSLSIRRASPLSPTPEGNSTTSPSHGEEKAQVDFAKCCPTLLRFGRNLSLAAQRGELDPVVGRTAEIEQVLDVLAKKQAPSPCLLGAAGVGKTSVVRGLALSLAQDPKERDHCLVMEIDTSAFLSGTGVRGALAERLSKLQQELATFDHKIILFFDEIHTLFGNDAGEEGVSAFKVALSRGDFLCIGATTEAEYRQCIESDPALARRFTPVEVAPLSPEQTFLALDRLVAPFATHHRIGYTQDALKASVTWSVRYLPDRVLPDKALSILDLAGARAQRRRLAEVPRELVAEVVADLSGVPQERLLETDNDRILRLGSFLQSRIVGHTGALAKIAAVLRRSSSGFRTQRPLGSFLLLGPTGVGKTETAKALAEALFDSPNSMTRLDLSEYAEPHSTARLVGAPPGYVGHEAGGQLTEAVRKKPYQVILLDEIEKAHSDVLEAFLQVLDEGRLTDGRGRTVDFSNTVILCTSNLGAEIATTHVEPKGKIGFASTGLEDIAYGELYSTQVLAAVRNALPPELLNRFDELLPLAPLHREEVREIARRLLHQLTEELHNTRSVHLSVEDNVLELLLDKGGFSPLLGARPMRRAISRHLENPLADALLAGTLSSGDSVFVEQAGPGLRLRFRKPDGHTAFWPSQEE